MRRGLSPIFNVQNVNILSSAVAFEVCAFVHLSVRCSTYSFSFPKIEIATLSFFLNADSSPLIERASPVVQPFNQLFSLFI